MSTKRRANSFTRVEVKLAREIFNGALYGGRPSPAIVRRKEFTSLLNKFNKMAEAFDKMEDSSEGARG